MTIFREEHGVRISPGAEKNFAEFGELYLKLRKAEARDFTIEALRKLPDVRQDHPQRDEWRIRRNTIRRFMKFLRRAPAMRILDIGCGNGFFSNIMARAGHSVVGVDVTPHELLLAAEAFGHHNPEWYCMDIMTEQVEGGPFDLVVFHASFQYFPDAGKVLNRCFAMMRKGGSVHILETPFYRDAGEAAAARQRSAHHFNRLGVSRMAGQYFFRTWSDLRDYRVRVRKPSGVISRLTRTASPFPWVEVRAAAENS